MAQPTSNEPASILDSWLRELHGGQPITSASSAGTFMTANPLFLTALCGSHVSRQIVLHVGVGQRVAHRERTENQDRRSPEAQYAEPRVQQCAEGAANEERQDAYRQLG